MRYIQNEELRDWIKDNLRKTIFQKAHALSIQTGCEILIKLHDLRSQEDSHQYYATGNLHKAYNCNGLQKHPKDKLVSGETGLPRCEYMDTGVQSGNDDSSETLNASYSTDLNADILDESVKVEEEQQQYIANDESGEIPLPLHLDVSDETPAPGNDAILPDEDKDVHVGQQEENIQEQSPMNVKVKIEKPDDEVQENALIGDLLNTNVQSFESNSFTGFQQPESMDTLSDAGLSLQDESQTVGRYSMPMSLKPYQCGICGKAFRSVQVLQKHTRTFHLRPQGSSPSQVLSRGMMGSAKNQTTPMKRYQCVMCSRSFPNPDLLTDHMSRSHMNTQSGTSQSALTFANTSAPSTATTPFTAGSKQGPFHITESSTITDQSQPTTSTAPLRHGLSWPIAPSSFASQRKRAMSGPSFRVPRVGRPSALGSSPKGQGTPPKDLNGKLRRPRGDDTITLRDIMSAILHTRGPVATHYAVVRYGPGYLRSVSKAYYDLAAQRLQEEKLGFIVNLTSPRSDVFVKKEPEEAQELLLGHPDLAKIEEYMIRYNSPAQACITLNMRRKLTQLGIVREGHFK